MHAVFDTVFEVTSFPRFQYLELASSFTRPGEVRAYWCLFYTDKGAVSVTSDGTEYLVETGCALFCRPGRETAVRVPDNLAANLYVIGFTLERGDLNPYEGAKFSITAELHAQIKLILKEAKFAYHNDLRDPGYGELEPRADGPYGAEQMMKLMMEQFLIYMVREAQAAQGPSYPEIVRENLIMNNLDANPFFGRLVHYLEENIDKQLTLEDICRDNYTNRSKIQRVFRECTSEGVISFHQKLKIEYAKLMIRKSNMNFTQISEALGFSSVHHFSKKFKQLVKMSPSEYARFSK